MSTLQVSNVHLESTGNNRIQYTGSNTFNIVAGGTPILSLNSTNLGIGTSSPVARLHVDGGQLISDGYGDTTAGSVSAVAIGVGDNDTGFYRTAFNVLDVAAGGTRAASFTSSGATIYGAVSTTGAITVDSASDAIFNLDKASGTGTINFKENGQTGWQLLNTSSGHFAVYRYVSGSFEDTPFAIYNNTGYVNVANRLGIGTSSPSAMLDVVGSSELNGDVVFGGAIDEKVYNLTGTALDPSNGTIQYKEITSNVTLTDSISEGESITVMIKSTTPNDTVTWPTTTWVNNGKTAPTTITGDWTVVALWKVSTTLYGALVGDGS